MEKGEQASKGMQQNAQRILDEQGEEGEEGENDMEEWEEDEGEEGEEGWEEEEEEEERRPVQRTVRGGKVLETKREAPNVGTKGGPNVGPRGAGPNLGSKGVGPKGVGPNIGLGKAGGKQGKAAPNDPLNRLGVMPNVGQRGPGELGPKVGPGKSVKKSAREKEEDELLNEDSIEWYQKRKRELKLTGR